MGTMIIEGKFSSAKIFTTGNEKTAIDDYAVSQIRYLCDMEANVGCRFRVMPDVHPGKVGTIGLTMTIGDKLMPNLTGIDIGCGVSVMAVKGKIREFQKLDSVIRDHVPSGFNIRSNAHHSIEEDLLSDLYCLKHVDVKKALLSCGSLGGGNHFIEVDQDQEGNSYVVVHSGSRRLGKEITEFYLREGQKVLKRKDEDVPYELAWLEGELMTDYLHDVSIAQKFAEKNRKIVLEELCKGMKWKEIDYFSCHHNYIDSSDETVNIMGAPVLRKGAISAKKGECVIIPINMRDGIILGKGKGNVDWNISAPHGAGRIIKREDVKSNFTLSQYKKEMKGIYSPSIGKDTLDEAPFVYRNLDDIEEVVGETVEIEKILKPVYNFKAGGKE